MYIQVEKRELSHPDSALRREWLDTNGLGDYASSTVVDCHTRKYHGLLVADLGHPLGRNVLLSRIEAALVDSAGTEFPLSTCRYPGVIAPEGFRYQSEFQQGPSPVSCFHAGATAIRRELALVREEHTVILRYDITDAAAPVALRLSPLFAMRGIHVLQHQTDHWDSTRHDTPHGFSVEPAQGLPMVHVCVSRTPHVTGNPAWYRNVEYVKDQRRGYEYLEDLWCPGHIEVSLKKGDTVYLCVSTTAHSPRSLSGMWQREMTGRENQARAFDSDPDAHLRRLKSSAARFLRSEGATVRPPVSGWHWYGSRVRDTLIALPGLTFESARMPEGVSILRQIAQRESNGMLPDSLDEASGNHVSRSPDISFWFFWTLQQMRAAGHVAQTDEFLPVLDRIVRAHLTASAPGCRLTEEGLVAAGDDIVPGTWMDACSQSHPCTPRHGVAVETAALWYNALRFWLELRAEPPEELAELGALVRETAARIEDSLVRCFWNDSEMSLGDVYRDGWLDRAVRPNQILAVSLPYSALPHEEKRSVVLRVTADLLTPFGLRTLSPADPRYCPRYEGDQTSRDLASHNGTVWPWLAAHYADAYLATCPDRRRGAMFLTDRLRPLLRALPESHAVDSLPEMFNGNPPHTPKGCIASALSVGETIRLHMVLRRASDMSGTTPNRQT